MTHVLTENMWLCDIPHSIVCKFGGDSSDSNQQQQQSFANSSTGNQAGQYANGPINSGQLQGALDSGQGIYNNVGQLGLNLVNGGIQNLQNGAQAGANLGATGNNTLNNTLNGSYLSADNPYFS